MNTRSILGIIAVLLIAGGIVYSAMRNSAPGDGVRPVDLAQFGVRITVPAELSDLSTEALTVPRLGTVLSMQASSIPSATPGKGCELGVMYLIEKSRVKEVGLNEADIKARSVPSVNEPPQVKEFADAYFIFEPSQAVCTSDSSLAQTEAAKRAALWKSVTSAERVASPQQ